MKVGLFDVDGHNFPNLPLMKISGHYKRLGSHVEMGLDALCGRYDKVYISKVFDFTPDYLYHINADEIAYGGTGYGIDNRLPDDIEHEYPDYGLYGIKDTAYGFITRGCPRQCAFCIVSQKEGCRSRKIADLSEFWRGQKEIKLLAPNLLACADSHELLRQLIISHAWIDFTQGLDIRCMTEETASLIMKCKIKMLHFAWDKESDSDVICRKLREFKAQTKIDRRKAGVYILTNYDTSFEFDLYRIYELRSIGYDPYVMIYDKANAPWDIRYLQRWVNNKRIFRLCENYEDYNPKIG